MQPWQVPNSKQYTPEEWETAQLDITSANKSNEGLESQGSGVLDNGLKAEVVVKAEPQEGDKPAKEQRKALTLKERLEICQATERQRLSFCKVRLLLGFQADLMGQIKQGMNCQLQFICQLVPRVPLQPCKEIEAAMDTESKALSTN